MRYQIYSGNHRPNKAKNLWPYLVIILVLWAIYQLAWKLPDVLWTVSTPLVNLMH